MVARQESQLLPKWSQRLAEWTRPACKDHGLFFECDVTDYSDKIRWENGLYLQNWFCDR